jgi:hypothetical protein
VNHFAEQEYAFALVFFDRAKRDFYGILDAVAKAEMPGEKYFYRSQVKHAWRKVFFQLVGLLSFALDGTDKRAPVRNGNVERFHGAKLRKRAKGKGERAKSKGERAKDYANLSEIYLLKNRRYLLPGRLSSSFRKINKSYFALSPLPFAGSRLCVPCNHELPLRTRALVAEYQCL